MEVALLSRPLVPPPRRPRNRQTPQYSQARIILSDPRIGGKTGQTYFPTLRLAQFILSHAHPLRHHLWYNTGKSGQTRFPTTSPLHLLYLGRRHPLKGLSYLESALATYYNMLSQPTPLDIPPEAPDTTYYNKCPIEFRTVSNVFGDELEKVWDWCDVLVLPTLSDNFGLVIAEALERGKRVITTDGAPAWGDGNDYDGRLIYLRGYRDGSPEVRVNLLKSAIESLTCRS